MQFCLFCSLFFVLLLTGGGSITSSSPKIISLTVQHHIWSGWALGFGPAPQAQRVPGAHPPELEMWTTPTAVSLGTPPQNLNLLLDTGSAQTVPYLKACMTEICRATSSGRYDPTVSTSSAGDIDRVLANWGYGAGTMWAIPMADTLTITGTPLGDHNNIRSRQNQVMYQIENYSFLAAYAVETTPPVPNSLWRAFLPSGDLGLQSSCVRSTCRNPTSALTKQKDKKQHPSSYGDYPPALGQLLPQLTTAGVIPNNIVAFRFSKPTPNGVKPEEDSFTVGGVDPTQFTGPIYWLNQNFPVTNVTVNNRPAPVSCSFVGCAATVDTGGGLLSLDVGLWWTIGVDCTGYSSLPTISFIFCSNMSLQFYPQDYIRRFSDNSTKTAQRCVSNIAQVVAVEGGNFSERTYAAPGVFTLAGRFFTKVYSVLNTSNDVDGTDFGFALPRA